MRARIPDPGLDRDSGGVPGSFRLDGPHTDRINSNPRMDPAKPSGNLPASGPIPSIPTLLEAWVNPSQPATAGCNRTRIDGLNAGPSSTYPALHLGGPTGAQVAPLTEFERESHCLERDVLKVEGPKAWSTATSMFVPFLVGALAPEGNTRSQATQDGDRFRACGNQCVMDS
jgi:hypothetical protein